MSGSQTGISPVGSGSQLILNNQTIAATGASGLIETGGASKIELIYSVGANTGGSPSITFAIQVIEPTSGAVISTTSGTAIVAGGGGVGAIALLTAATSTVTGDSVKVTWTIGASNSWANVYARLIVKK